MFLTRDGRWKSIPRARKVVRATLNSVPGENPDEVKVLKVAPTGKAAFNIKGNTLHSAFKIPVNRGFQYCTLDADQLNTIRAQLKRLQVIFVDEISMLGSGMFNFLNLIAANNGN